MTETEIKRLVLEVLAGIAPEAELDRLPGEAELRENLYLNSMDFLNFIAGLHERARIDIPEADYLMLYTLDRAIACLRRADMVV